MTGADPNPKLKIDWPRERVEAFCRRWRICELAVFGSVLRADFDPESDIDVLVSFEHDAEWSLLDHHRIEAELAALLGRGVDLITRSAVERSKNWIRRQAILESSRSVYAAR
jgi:predicted nucleotidyltransferase